MTSFHVHPDISEAATIHTDFYTQPAIFEEAKEKIFAPCWQYAGHEELVARPGSVHPFNLLPGYLDEPLLLSREKDGGLHCLSNVCTHRGNLLAYEPCTAAHLRCRYHGRVFSLDGRFQSMPEFREVNNFPTEKDHLASLPLFRWGPLLFTSLKPALPAEAFFSEMMQRVGWLPLQKMEYSPELFKDYTVGAHWALYCENYLEGFHIPFVHAGLNTVLDFGNYTTELFRYSNLQLGIAKDGEDCFELPPGSPDYGKKVAAYYFWVYPNMMFNFYPWGLSFNLVQPLSLSQTKVSFHTFVYDAAKLDTGAGASLHQVELEDEEVVEHVQKGVRSRFYQQGRYSVTREQGTHHFHRLLAQSFSA
jgi:choline monooxygenase